MRRVKELIAILMVGDGVLALVASRGHSLLWRFGPGHTNEPWKVSPGARS